MKGNSAYESLLSDLRRALRHLYDPVELCKSPFVELLGTEQRKDPALSMRRLLIDAIEALKPDPTVPARSTAWRTYRILHYRYVEQLTQREVATDLSLSLRQVQRQENRALRALTAHLCARYDLEPTAFGQGKGPSQAEGVEPLAETGTASQEQELEWLRRSVPCEPTDIGKVISRALELVGPSARSLDVHMENALPEDLAPVVVQPVTIRQAMLIVMSAAIQSVPGGRVRIEAEVRRGREYVEVRAARGSANAPPLGASQLDNLQMAQRLVELSAGVLKIVADDGGREPFRATMALPALERVPVLVVDDNADTLRLLQRYLAGTRYRFVGARNRQQLFASVESLVPQIVVLDVMLPGVDGWELLGRLRTHPQTCDMPIIVCTILDQEELALSLGAAAFIKKPVSRRDFLSALDEQLALPLTASH